MRLNKYIAQAGLASRREADELTKEGKVTINGAVMKEPGYDVQEGDLVRVNGKLVSAPEKLCYYALNKPEGYITSTRDDRGRPTVLSLMTDVNARVFPVGRLDYDTSGLLIMTNDGALSERVAHPKGEVKKTYLARMNGPVSRDQLRQLQNGVMIDIPAYGKGSEKGTRKYKTKPAEVSIVYDKTREYVLQITISEGKNRQIRKMAEAVGLKVLALERISIGSVRLGRTKPGTYRKLTPEEIEYLKNC
ncbi:MAG: rRNA pseudouridine synthase [Firmicutes bacterium]|nr:rRNA pseudouridine synthase [Bacillota bacterium]